MIWLKTVGVGIGTMIVLALFDWGTLTWLPTLIAIGVAVWYYRSRSPGETP